MSTPTVFIFGATGAVGGALVNELLPDHKAGRLKLVAAVRRPEAVAAFESQGLETRLIDLDRAEMAGLTPVVEAMRGANARSWPRLHPATSLAVSHHRRAGWR